MWISLLIHEAIRRRKLRPPTLKLYDPLSDVDFTRACGLSECADCGELYYDHPTTGPLGYDGKPFLHVLCDGRMVKL